jgi:ABC-type uncharacterized transport system involved in gliding motility auxiliary subunit
MERVAMQSKNSIIGLLGIILIAVGLLVWAIFETMNAYGIAPLALGAVMLLAYVAMNIQFLTKKLTGRTAVQGTNAFISVLVFLVIVVFVEMLLVNHSTRFDFTKVKKYSLATQSIQLVKTLEDPITFLFLENPNFPGETARARDLMELYAHYSDKITIDIIDPEKEPQKVEQLAPVTLGAIYVQQKAGTHEKVSPVDENNLTNAILKIVSGGEKVVYFTTGHDEASINAEVEDLNSVSGIKDMLGEEGYTVKELALYTLETVPDDADAILIVGPKKPFLEPEIDTLFNFIDQGGNVLFFLDPETNHGLDAALDTKLGVELGNNWVLENNPLMQMMGGKPYQPLMNQVADHPIMEAFQGRITALPFPIVQSVMMSGNQSDAITYVELIKTSQDSWAETNLTALKTLGEAELNPDEDITGPVTIAVALTKAVDKTDSPAEESAGESDGEDDNTADEEHVEKLDQTPEARVLVFGDSDFIKSTRFQSSFDLIVNSVNWATNQEDLISIRAKDDAGEMIMLTAFQGNLIFYSTLVILPSLLALLGIIVFVVRAKKG